MLDIKPIRLITNLNSINSILDIHHDIAEDEAKEAMEVMLDIEGKLSGIAEDLLSHLKYIEHCKKSKITLHKKAPQD